MTEKAKSSEPSIEIIEIKRAVPEDAEATMNLKRQAWLKAYVSEEYEISIDDIEKKFPEDSLPNAIENWQKGIASEQDKNEKATFVARLDGKVVGLGYFVQFRVDFGQEKMHLHELGRACEGGLFLWLNWGVFDEEGYVAVEEVSGFFVGFVHGPLLQFRHLCLVVFLIVT